MGGRSYNRSNSELLSLIHHLWISLDYIDLH